MLEQTEHEKIETILKSLSWDELQETLMRVEVLVAEKQNKIVSEGSDYVQ
jgi:hypothetical protein